MSDAWRITPKGVEIFVRLTPGSSASRIIEQRDGALRIAVTAKPVDGAANEALLRLLAKTCAVPFSSLSFLRGGHARDKTVLAAGAGQDLAARLAGLIQHQ